MKTTAFHHSRAFLRCSYLRSAIAVAVACAVLTALTCAATNRTWTGSSGIDNNWMTPGNWQGSVAPVPGDNLIFPAIVSGGSETNHNNYPDGTLFGNISISTGKGQDYALGGNRIVLTNGISEGSTGFAAGGAFVFFDITISNNQTFIANGGLILNNTIDTSGNSLTMGNSGSVTINGIFENSYGLEPRGNSLEKTNTGTLTISATGTINGFLNVGLDGGTLAMRGTADSARFNVGQGSLIVDGSIALLALDGDGFNITGTGNLGATDDEFAEGSDDTFTPGDNGAPGIMEFNSFYPAAGLSGNDALQIVIAGTQPGTNYGQLLVTNGYSLISGDMFLYSPTALVLQWNYAPQVGDSFQVITQAPAQPYSVANNYYFNGLPPNSIDDSTNGASLGVYYSSNGVTLTTLRTASSPFVLWKGSLFATTYGSRDWSLTNNWAQNAGPASGDVLVFSPYQTSYYTNTIDLVPVPPQVTNDLASGTSLAGLVFTGSGNAITVTGGITNETPAGGTNFFHPGIAAAGALSLDVEPGGNLLMDGVIAGSGTVSKTGGGLLIYDGVTSDAFVGTVAVSSGTLEMDGSFTDGSFSVNGGILGGTGTVSAVTVNSGGTLKPGDSPGVLHVNGPLTMAPGALFTAELDGPIPGSGYDQLQVSGGSVNLNGATLNLQPNFIAGVGAAFIILVNNGMGPITGTFAGLPEGTIFQAGGQFFSISYQAAPATKTSS